MAQRILSLLKCERRNDKKKRRGGAPFSSPRPHPLDQFCAAAIDACQLNSLHDAYFHFLGSLMPPSAPLLGGRSSLFRIAALLGGRKRQSDCTLRTCSALRQPALLLSRCTSAKRSAAAVCQAGLPSGVPSAVPSGLQGRSIAADRAGSQPWSSSATKISTVVAIFGTGIPCMRFSK